MSDASTRRSPIHQWLEARQPHWSDVGGRPIAIRFQSEESESAAMATLGLCDLSPLAKLGVKGRDAEKWLRGENIDLPANVYESRRLVDGALIVRLGADEFLLESGLTNDSVSALETRLESHQGHVVLVDRQEATFLLVGSRAIEVLSQTCGVNFQETAPQSLVLTRVAGVSCGVFSDSVGELSAYRLWIDYSYAVYLWETLVEICESLDGCVIGAGCIFPELLS